MNLVIAGTDPVAVDAEGSAVMSVPLEDVKHLLLAEKKGLGTCQLANITVLGEPRGSEAEVSPVFGVEASCSYRMS